MIGRVREGATVGGVTPASGVRWEGYRHAELWDMIMRSKPDELFARVDRWHAIADKLAECNEFLQKRLNVLLTTWRAPPRRPRPAASNGSSPGHRTPRPGRARSGHTWGTTATRWSAPGCGCRNHNTGGPS